MPLLTHLLAAVRLVPARARRECPAQTHACRYREEQERPQGPQKDPMPDLGPEHAQDIHGPPPGCVVLRTSFVALRAGYGHDWRSRPLGRIADGPLSTHCRQIRSAITGGNASPSQSFSVLCGLLGIFLLHTAMTWKPGTPSASSLAYVGLWVGAAAAIIATLWLARRSSQRGPLTSASHPLQTNSVTRQKMGAGSSLA